MEVFGQSQIIEASKLAQQNMNILQNVKDINSIDFMADEIAAHILSLSSWPVIYALLLKAFGADFNFLQSLQIANRLRK